MVIHRSFFVDSVKNCVFLHVSFKAYNRQLTHLRLRINKAKSNSDLFIFSTNVSIKGFRKFKSLSLSIFFALLLVCHGVEPNPGPSNTIVVSQNCRGLTDSAKLISVLKKAYDKPNLSKILCLQETHHLNRFALDNHFRGSCVIDNGERAQKGTAILVPDQFTVCLSKVSGRGRWAMAAIKSQLNDTFGDGVVVVVSIYAPNCHIESQGFFADLFEVIDEFMEDVSMQYGWPQLILAGDFNFVFHPRSDSLNRLSSQNESTLAAYVESNLEERELIDSICFDSLGTDRYTWRRANCCSRLDYIFLSTGLSSQVQCAKTDWYQFGSKYDHASVTVTMGRKTGFSRGRSFPKLYKSDISSPVSVAWVGEQLEQAKRQIPIHWNPHQVHEFLKMTLRSKTLEIRAMNKRLRVASLLKRELTTSS